MMPGARHLLARCRSWLEAVARALGQLLSLLERPLPVEASRPPRVLLVTAHPDDECMFFTPTLSSLAAAGAELWLLCLSTGECAAAWPAQAPGRGSDDDSPCLLRVCAVTGTLSQSIVCELVATPLVEPWGRSHQSECISPLTVAHYQDIFPLSGV